MAKEREVDLSETATDPDGIPMAADPTIPALGKLPGGLRTPRHDAPTKQLAIGDLERLLEEGKPAREVADTLRQLLPNLPLSEQLGPRIVRPARLAPINTREQGNLRKKLLVSSARLPDPPQHKIKIVQKLFTGLRTLMQGLKNYFLS